jgi:HPr kinase/phosphorylase
VQPSGEQGPGHGVTVETFLETGRDALSMELVAGAEGVKHRILEATLHRPGLALTGFFEHFAHRRIQVLGMAEMSYLASLPEAEASRRIRDFLAHKIPCVVLTRGRSVPGAMTAMAHEFHVPVLRSAMITKLFINAGTIVMENLMAPRTTAQGTMVSILGIGVLIEGRAGIGKSEAALGLLRRGHALVSDDVTSLRLDSRGTLVASPPRATRFHMEIRGLGIIHVPSLFGVASVWEEKRVDLVVTLCEPGAESEGDRSGETRASRRILGVSVPQVFVPVAPGRELANVIETAALDYRLRRLGHDAEKELDEKLTALMTRGADGRE